MLFLGLTFLRNFAFELLAGDLAVFRRGILTPLAGEYLFNFDPC